MESEEGMKRQMKLIKNIFPDAEVYEVKADYEDFHAIIDGVKMIFYPHKVKSTHNYHTRVRNGSPLKKDRFLALVSILNSGKQPSCTFTVKNHFASTFWFGENKRNIETRFPEYQKYWELAAKHKTEEFI